MASPARQAAPKKNPNMSIASFREGLSSQEGIWAPNVKRVRGRVLRNVFVGLRGGLLSRLYWLDVEFCARRPECWTEWEEPLPKPESVG